MDNWTFEQFLGFVLIHAANADDGIAKKERKLLDTRVGSETIEEMLDIYEDLSDIETINKILSYKEKYYPTEEDKESLLGEISKVLEIDHGVSSAEQEAFMMMRKLLR